MAKLRNYDVYAKHFQMFFASNAEKKEKGDLSSASC